MGAVTGSLFKIGEYLVFAAFAFHAINGIRLGINPLELWVAVGGGPIEPVYPYRTSLDVQRPLAIGVLVLAAVIFVLGTLNFWVLE